MNNKQKEIEKLQINSMIEFFKWILPTQAMADWIPIRIRHDYKGYAKEFYNLGYRKIDEDSVVLTREEFWKLSNKFSRKELDDISQFRVNKARKKTAKEILTAQLKDCIEAEKRVLKIRKSKDDLYYNGFSLAITNLKMYIKELAKQYGVIGEENV